MSSLELTSTITAIANALTCKLTTDQTTLLAAVLVQPGDTLVIIATLNQNYTENETERIV